MVSRHRLVIVAQSSATTRINVKKPQYCHKFSFFSSSWSKKSFLCFFFWFDMLLFIIHTAAGLSGSQMCISIVWCRHQMYLQYGIIETLFISYCDQTISELWDVVWHINSCRTCSGAGCAGCCSGELHYLSDNLVPDISAMRILHTWVESDEK